MSLYDGMPVLSMKHPVPYVFFASPGSVQNWPSKAACWSPRHPAIGTPSNVSPFMVPISEELLTLGKHSIGIPNSLQISLSHCRVSKLSNMVRLAFVTSVTTPPLTPPVKCQIIQLSTVPIS
eukprot:10758_1